MGKCSIRETYAVCLTCPFKGVIVFAPMEAALPPLRVAAFTTAAVVSAVFLAHAVVLVGYPWDWSPDEGLTLDYARRLVQAPDTLYAKTVVPVPLEYTPLLTVVLAPVVAVFDRPLGPA